MNNEQQNHPAVFAIQLGSQTPRGGWVMHSLSTLSLRVLHRLGSDIPHRVLGGRE